ncbi:RNA-dependent RNA polymerase [Rhizoctonia solani]|uniref:RNA-dependent RNA polymerase n=1 Tax=Rhizoctonia solani TaxID=456999 RepID=A0A8H8P9K0_9AGAM|nr:RNA-dependent RNA polymerase [Rhizoctonia solani]QRW26303.1 RNA-dependent RNA polymerase [Rhizoctonia solani]
MRQPALTNPWEELDREETLIRDRDCGASIDNSGGKIKQRMRLDIVKSDACINKWATRFALGFSTSHPGLIFLPEDIHLLHDEYTTGKSKSTAATHEILTDGCGFLNYTALKVIEQKMAWGRFPTCIQARIAASNMDKSRLRRVVSPDAQRAYGLLDFDDEDGEEEGTALAKWDAGPDPFSGQPASAQEQVLGWLQAGFLPTDKFVMEKYHETHVFKYPIQERLWPSITTSSGLGATLIIFSVKGSRSLASLLSGGDYDGDTVVLIWDEQITSQFRNAHKRDTVVLIWDEQITSQFRNAHKRFADPGPGFESRNLIKSKKLLKDIKTRADSEGQDITKELISALLEDIAPSQLGMYNIFYRNSVYLYGLDHPTTARLGHMFTQCLDSVKSGLKPKPEVLRADKQIWNKRQPDCFPSKTEEDGTYGSLLLFPDAEAAIGSFSKFFKMLQRMRLKVMRRSWGNARQMRNILST